MKGWCVWVTPCGKNWRCRWKGKYGTGQEVLIYAADARELAEKKKRNFARMDSGLSPIQEARTVLLQEWSRLYLAERSKNPRVNTYTKDQEALGQFLDWASKSLGPADLATVTTADIYRWKDWLYSEKEYSHATVRMRLAHLGPAFSWAKKRGWITSNPVDDVERPKPTKSGRVLTAEEINTMYSIPPRHVVLAFVLLLNSGMRKGEVVSLRKSQIEKRDNDLWRVHFDGAQTKNGKPKAVVLNTNARQAIEESMNRSTSERVFELITKDVFDYWMRRVQEKIGPVRLHDLKHTFCTLWMRATGDLDGLRQMTGNSLTSLKIYYHLALGTPRGMASFEVSMPTHCLNGISP